MLGGTLGFLLEILACIHITTTVAFCTIGSCILFIALLFTRFWYIPLIYAAWMIIDRNTPFQAGRRFEFIGKLFIWKYLVRYFPIRLHKTADLDPSKNYLFAFHPHAMATFGAVAHFLTSATGWNEAFPGIKVKLLTINGQFRFPFYREYLLAAGFGGVDASSIDYKLTKMGPGHSVAIVIGGQAEVLLVDHSKYIFKLEERKGFIRRVIKTGACVVPVISFNEHRVYDVSYDTKEGTLLNYISRLVKLCFGVDTPADVRGRPGYWAFVPKQVPIDTVIGAPIDFCEMKSFTKGQDPPEELVEECHKYYLEQFRKLYDDHKAKFGDENTPLVFV